MVIKLLSGHSSNNSLIIIFLGWGMDATPFGNISREGHDVALCYGYDGSSAEAEQYRSFIKSYTNVYLFAWSYGVAIANSLLDGKEKLAVAINGVVTPKDDRYGIPQRIFDLTLRSISIEGMQKFYTFTGMTPPFPDRTTDSLKDELSIFGNITTQTPSEFWDIAYIGTKDRIIPPANQLNLWEEAGVELRRIEGGAHYIDIQSIINENIINKELVRERFTSNTDTYENEAEVQKTVASGLYDRLKKSISRQLPCPPVILELGCGTGFLTRLYSSDFDTSRSSVIDIARKEAITSSFERANVGFKGEITEGDAEELIHTLPPCCTDVLVSSSAIQWFTNLPRFFSNLERILKPGGYAAIATYIEGTFSNIPGRSLHYYSRDSLLSLVPDSLEVRESSVMTHTIGFNSPKELFSHIRNTGVNAVSKTIPPGEMRTLIKQLSANPSLDFTTLYLILQKKYE